MTLNNSSGASVLSVNTGEVRVTEWQGRFVPSAIWKHPVDGRIPLRGVNFLGDDQADRSVHGGPDKAVYAYSQEDYDHWHNVEHIATEPGLFGENLTVQGIDLSEAVAGERWAVGTTVLEVAQPRLPCFKLAMRMGDPHFVKRFFDVERMGAYLRVIQEGDVAAGDSIEVVHRPDHGITLRDMTQSLDNPAAARRLLVIDRLPEFWRRRA